MYVDLETFLAAKLPDIRNDEEKNAIEAMLKAASSFVDKQTNRPKGFFGLAPVEPKIKRFRGDGSKVLRIPAHIQESVIVQDVSNSAWYESEGNNWLYQINSVWKEDHLYQVSARWGFEEIPPEIVECVSMITLRWWETQKGTLGQITPTGFVIERDLPPAAQIIIEAWTKGEYEI